uniref:G_PROTEIN_RECEP_F1_2 domain-containing protein n=1 Tax=Steinernema glaseri TaxID=37863 RepID=A0A1I7ZKX4_9BILA
MDYFNCVFSIKKSDSIADCSEARRLANSLAMKVVLIVKISLNFTAAALIVTVVRTCRRKKLFVMHQNIKILLYFHFYYVIHVAFFMTVGLIIDFIRLSLQHDDDCDYLIPVWLTFTLKCSFVFGVFAETITIAYISVERFVATYYKEYERAQCSFLMPLLIVAKIVFVSFISYVLLGIQMNWSARVVVFTFRTEENGPTYELVTYALMAVEVCSIVLYHFTLYVNHRDTKALHLTKSREVQLTKTLSAKYQMEENTKVIRMVLPIVWSHFIFVVIWGVCKTVYQKVCEQFYGGDHKRDKNDRIKQSLLE